MTALDRLRDQVRDLTQQFIDDDVDERPLMQQLVYLGPHIIPARDVVGKTQPTSRPPGNLAAHQLHDTIMAEALTWAWTLSGARVRQDRCLLILPVLAQQRVDTGDNDKTKILHGRTGLYSAVGKWHLSVRILLGYDRPADRYPLATCPQCHQRDDRGGTIRARETLAWCSNPDCRDEHGHRTEFSILYLQQLLRDAIADETGTIMDHYETPASNVVASVGRPA